MGSLVRINGNTLEERNGKLFLNGTEIKNNSIDSKSSKFPAFFAGAVSGIVFLILITELASAA